MTYGKGGGTLPATVGIATGATLPVTGATDSWMVTTAVAIVAGLVVWGTLYAIKNRVR